MVPYGHPQSIEGLVGSEVAQGPGFSCQEQEPVVGRQAPFHRDGAVGARFDDHDVPRLNAQLRHRLFGHEYERLHRPS